MRFSTPDQAQAAFYHAFQHAEIDAMMAVWANDDNVICVHPAGERLLGVDAVRRSWREIFSSGPQLRFELMETRVHKSESVALYSMYERISVSGELGAIHIILATNMYILDETGWRMLVHHASPIAANVPRPQGAAGTVH